MNDFSIAMALVDYVPVLLFAAAAILLQWDLYQKMGKGSFALFAAGTVDIFCAGFLKATWKLLYAANICDFRALDEMFFPVQSIGFLLAGLGIVTMLCCRQKKALLSVAVPPVFSGTFLFVGLMVAGLACMNAGLSYMAVKMKKPAAMVCFVIAFVCCMGMGYLSSQDFAQASMNWIAEGINVVGQGALLLGVVTLHKAGLAVWELPVKN